MSAPMFIFGGDTGVKSPQELKRLRAMANALAGNSSAPKNIGEGLNAIGQALIYRSTMNDANAMEKAGLESANATMNPIIGALGGSSTPPSSGPSPDKVGAALLGTPDAANEMASTDPAPDVSKNGSTFQPFIDTVKQAGLTNPFGLAAVASTGKAESGWSPENAARSWSDPSESGKPGTAGGVMSWRGPRLQALQQFAAAKGEQGNGSPQTQAEFFAQEDPQLIAKLNTAKSPEEAQLLMNGAWKFRGYNRPGGEAARRIGMANAYAPQFQGSNTEVASLDPAAGMSAASAIEAQAPGSGYVDPSVVAPNYRPPAQQAPATGAGQFDNGRFGDPIKLAEMPASQAQLPGNLSAQTNAYAPQQQAPAQLPPLPSRDVGPAPRVAGAPQAASAPPSVAPNQVAQAGPQQSGPTLQQLYQALQNPWLSEGQQALIANQINRIQSDQDPDAIMKRRYMQAQMDALTAKPNKQWQKLDDGTLFNPETGETKDVAGGATQGKFRFKGKSPEAEALNGLMDSGKLTEEQAQQLGAGKTITNPADGSLMFMTPQGLVGQPANGGPALPLAAQPNEGIDIFADGPAANAPAPASAASAAAPTLPPGAVQLTAPKAKDTALPAEMGARIGLGDSFIQNVPKLRERLARGDASGPYDGAKLALGIGDPASIWRDIDSGRDALVRNLTGAGMSESEAQNQAARYQISPTDSAETMVEKLDNLERDLLATRRGAIDARTGNMKSEPAAGWTDVDGVKIRRKAQ